MLLKIFFSLLFALLAFIAYKVDEEKIRSIYYTIPLCIVIIMMIWFLFDI